MWLHHIEFFFILFGYVHIFFLALNGKKANARHSVVVMLVLVLVLV